jgi:hypothetical protein
MVEALLGGTTVRYCVEEVDDEGCAARWEIEALLGGRGGRRLCC